MTVPTPYYLYVHKYSTCTYEMLKYSYYMWTHASVKPAKHCVNGSYQDFFFLLNTLNIVYNLSPVVFTTIKIFYDFIVIGEKWGSVFKILKHVVIENLDVFLFLVQSFIRIMVYG